MGPECWQLLRSLRYLRVARNARNRLAPAQPSCKGLPADSCHTPYLVDPIAVLIALKSYGAGHSEETGYGMSAGKG